MEQINNFFDRIASPLSGLANWLLRLGLGVAFFLHGYGKLPISDGFVGWLIKHTPRKRPQNRITDGIGAK